MSTSTLASIFTTSITTFWDYLTPNISPWLTFAVVTSLLGLLLYVVVRKIRHIV